jgi:hypothetical protein
VVKKIPYKKLPVVSFITIPIFSYVDEDDATSSEPEVFSSIIQASLGI